MKETNGINGDCGAAQPIRAEATAAAKARNAHTPWTIRENPNKDYPDLPTYSILEPNPDAGRKGVSYSGDLLMVCTVDSLEVARLIEQAPAMLEALRDMSKLLAQQLDDADEPVDASVWAEREIDIRIILARVAAVDGE